MVIRAIILIILNIMYLQAAEGRRRALRLPLDATDAQCEAGEQRRQGLTPAECRMAELWRWQLRLAEDATDAQCDLAEAAVAAGLRDLSADGARPLLFVFRESRSAVALPIVHRVGAALFVWARRARNAPARLETSPKKNCPNTVSKQAAPARAEATATATTALKALATVQHKACARPPRARLYARTPINGCNS